MPPKDRSLARLLLEVPALPNDLLDNLFKDLREQGDEHATLALIIARDVALMRPPNRQQALDAMLSMAVGQDEGLR